MAATPARTSREAACFQQVSNRTRPFTVFSHVPPCEDREWAVPSGLDDRSRRVLLVLPEQAGAAAVRMRLAELGISEAEVTDAVVPAGADRPRSFAGGSAALV